MVQYTGGAGDDFFAGSPQGDIADGNGGNDQLNGGGGADNLAGGAGADVIDGGSGSDQLHSDVRTTEFSLPYYDADFTPPLLDRGTQIDTLRGGDGDDFISAGYGDHVDGGALRDYLFISFMGAPSGITADFSQPTITVGGGEITGIEDVIWAEGSEFDDDIKMGDGSGEFNTVFGMGGNDRLVANYYTGSMFGGTGNDVIDGRGSQYLGIVDGGDGNDTLYTDANTFARASGGAGNDLIYAHGKISGGSGNDRIYVQWSYYPGRVTGDAGNDLIEASSDAAVISGGSGADTIRGGAGDDLLASGTHAQFVATPDADMGVEKDVLSGGDGNDVLYAGIGDDIDGGAGVDRLWLSLGGAAGGIDIDTTALAAGDDFSFAGGMIRNVERLQGLSGSAGNDRITIGAHAVQVTVDGGAGDDVIIASGSVRAIGGDGNDQITGGAAGDQLDGGSGSDNIDGGDGNDIINGNDGDDYLFGGSGADRISGGNDTDYIDGGTDDDNIRGDAGDDTIFGSEGDDAVSGGDGNDLLSGGDGDDAVSGGAGDDVIEGDIVFFLPEGGNDRLNGGAGNDDISGGGGDDVLLGGAGNDQLRGDYGADILEGGEGDDFLNGFGAEGYGVDTGRNVLRGGGGNDQFYARYGDTIDGGDGVDTASFIFFDATSGVTADFRALTDGGEITIGGASVSGIEIISSLSLSNFDDVVVAGATFNGTGITISGADGNDDITGSAGADLIFGGEGNDTLRGGVGIDPSVFPSVDRLFGEAGNDIILIGSDGALVSGGIGNDRIEGGSAVDDLRGDQGNDLVQGGGGEDALYGGDGNDRLLGGDGDDVLYGEDGDDVLSGGAGNDTLDAGLGNNLINGGSGNDTLRIDEFFDFANISVDGATLVLTTSGGVQRITQVETLQFYDGSYSVADLLSGDTLGTGNADTLRGTKGNDAIRSLGGSDRIFGSAGTDRIYAGEGDSDQLIFTLSDSASFDPLTGPTAFSLGNGTVTDAARSFFTRYEGVSRLTFDLRNTGDYDYQVTATGFTPEVPEFGTALLSLYTGNGDDRIAGSAGDDFISSGEGSDFINAGAGFDDVVVTARLTADGTNRIVIREDDSGVYVEQGSEVDRIVGAERVRVALTSASDPAIGVIMDGSAATTDLILSDGRGDDVLIGGAGDDIFTNSPGGVSGGSDVYTGGAGADLYDFVVATSGFDGTVITDFAAEDVIDLSFNDGFLVPGEPVATRFIGYSAFSGAVGEIRYRFAEGQTLVEIDFDGDAAADATLTIANGTFDLGAFPSFGENPFEYELGIQITGVASVIEGSEGRDLIRGTAANETIAVFGGNDTVSAGAGNDRVDGGGGNDVLRGLDGDDLLLGDDGDDELVGGAGRDALDGGAGNDVLTGNTGDGDRLEGGAGDDVLSDAGTHGHLRGGDGDDQLLFVGVQSGDRSEIIFVDGGLGDDAITIGGYSVGGFVQGGFGDDSITLSGIVDLSIDGGQGDDRFVVGTPSNIQIRGDAGRDSIELVDGSHGSVLVWDFQAGEAGDRIDLSIYGTDAFADGTLRIEDWFGSVAIFDDAGGHVFELYGAELSQLSRYNLGIDTGLYAPSDKLVEDPFAWDPTIDFAATLYGGDANDIVRGFGGDDTLFGAAGNDRIEGGLGDDEIDGGSGADQMVGGAGDDVFYVDNALDRTFETAGGGTDTVVSSIDMTLRAEHENLVLDGTARVGNGNALDNAIVGNGSDNFLRGLGGADVLLGGAGADRIDGGAGDDLLNGGLGIDVLTGGDGADRFAFGQGELSIDPAASDRLVDFDRTEGDRIDFSGIDADVRAEGDQSFSFVARSAFGGIAGELRYTVVGGATTIEADVDGDRAADWVLRLDTQVLLEAGDIVL